MDLRLASGLGPEALRPVAPLKSKFEGFEELPTPTFLEAIEPIHRDGAIPRFNDYAQITYEQARDRKLYGDLRDDRVDIEGVAALMKWTSADSNPPFHQVLTQRCYNRDRRTVEPFAQFVWLMLKAMQLIEPFQQESVFRGVRGNVGADYVKGREFTWHSPSSCTKSIEVLQEPNFFGDTGPRTIFAIRLTQGQARDISRYSMLPDENEVLLPPGCRFKSLGVLPAGDVTIVQIEEIVSKELILDLAPAPGPPPQPVAHETGTTTLYHGPSEEKENAAAAAEVAAATVRADAQAAEAAPAAAQTEVPEAKAAEAAARAEVVAAQAATAAAPMETQEAVGRAPEAAATAQAQASSPDHNEGCSSPHGTEDACLARYVDFVPDFYNNLEQLAPGHLRKGGGASDHINTVVSTESILVASGGGLRFVPGQDDKGLGLGLNGSSGVPESRYGIDYLAYCNKFHNQLLVYENGEQKFSGRYDAYSTVDLWVTAAGVEVWVDGERLYTGQLRGQERLYAVATFSHVGGEAVAIEWLEAAEDS